MVDTDPGLRRIADRIANNPYWDGPHEMGSAVVWFARIPSESGRQEVGRMELTEDRLTVRGYAAHGVRSMTQSAAGRYRLTSSSLFPEPRGGHITA